MDPVTPAAMPDARQIILHDSIETPYWCHLLAVTEAHLVSAIEAVGPRAQDVKDYLALERCLHAEINAKPST